MYPGYCTDCIKLARLPGNNYTAITRTFTCYKQMALPPTQLDKMNVSHFGDLFYFILKYLVNKSIDSLEFLEENLKYILGNL